MKRFFDFKEFTLALGLLLFPFLDAQQQIPFMNYGPGGPSVAQSPVYTGQMPDNMANAGICPPQVSPLMAPLNQQGMINQNQQYQVPGPHMYNPAMMQ